MCKTEDKNSTFDPFIEQIESSMQEIMQQFEVVDLNESKLLVGDLGTYEEEELVEHQGLKSEVILFVDNREKRNNQDGSYLYDRLSKNGFQVELKSLPLGDFVWVLRVYNTNDVKQEKKKKQKQESYTDYLLDFIVERKTADDLAASIMDGRYEE